MMIELLPDVIFVEGAVNGAIYDLVRERVFAVNSSAASIIRKTILPDALTDGERSCRTWQ